MCLMEAEIQEKISINQQRDAVTQRITMSNIKLMETAVSRNSSGGKLEDSDRLMLKDMFKNAISVETVTVPSLPQITNTTEAGSGAGAAVNVYALVFWLSSYSWQS